MREGLVVFGVAPWENGLPDPECDDGPYIDEGQMDMWGWNLCRKRNEALQTMTADKKKPTSVAAGRFEYGSLNV